VNGDVVRDLLLALQGLQVTILALHDWIPLGKLNDVKAVRAQDTLTQLLTVTAVQTVPFAFGLVCSVFYRYTPYPGWLYGWLWVSYGALFIGQIQAWWIPYLIRPQPKRAARYQRVFGTTHSVLPVRNGITPNTLHLMLHLATLATLVLLGFEPR